MLQSYHMIEFDLLIYKIRILSFVDDIIAEERKESAHPRDQNSDACITPLRGDSHLLTASMIVLCE